MKISPPSVRKALSLSFARSGVSFVFTTAAVMIVSRLLTPAEIGVFSVAMALVALAQMLRSFGAGELIIQEKVLTTEIIRTTFTVNLAIALTIAAALFGFSGLIGRFYGDPGVARVTRVLSLVFVLMPFGVVTMARMKREMLFGVFVRIQLINTVVLSTTTVLLAYLGFSYMSMAWGTVAATVAMLIGCGLWGGSYRVRGFGFSEWRRVLHFGINRTVADIVQQLGEQSANIIVGRMLGMAPAGFYSRGYGIVNLFYGNVIRTISSVALPAYARDHREANAAPLLFRKSLIYVTGISWPFFSFAALMAFPLIRLAFGSQWDASVPLMRWLCVAAVIATLTYQCSDMLTAVGRYREVTRVEIQYQLARIALAVIAAFHSLEAVAASQVAVYMVAVVLYYRRLVRYDALRLRELAKALLPSLVLAVATSVTPVLVLLLWPGPMVGHYLPAFVVAAGGASITWVAGLFVLGHPLADEVRRVLSVVHQWIRTAVNPG